MAVITISRQMAAGGEAIAEALADRLGYTLVDQAAITDLLVQRGVRRAQLRRIDERSPAFLDAFRPERHKYLAVLHQELERLASDKDLVVLGRGGNFIFWEHPGALHVKVVASWPVRLSRQAAADGVEADEAALILGHSDRDRAGYVHFFYGRDWMDPTLYDLVLNTDHLDGGEAVALVAAAARSAAAAGRSRTPAVPERAVPALPGGASAGTESIQFAHPSEAEFARMLDFYGVQWLYEPRSFPLEWDGEGNVVEAFTPDFYLPALDLYIELTTMKQSLVTRKNAKLRRLRALYPHVHIKLFYGRDYRSLLRKHGRD